MSVPSDFDQRLAALDRQLQRLTTEEQKVDAALKFSREMSVTLPLQLHAPAFNLGIAEVIHRQ